MRLSRLCVAPVLLLLAAISTAQDDVVMKAMQDEMARSMSDLKLADSPKPYFIAYRVALVEVNTVGATLGSLLPVQPQASNMIAVEVRVGDLSLDNTNFMATEMFSMGPAGFLHGLRTGPLQDDYAAVRRELWRATDEEYKRAVEDYAAKKAAMEGRRLSEPLPDFSAEAQAHASGPRPAPHDGAAAQQLARDLSAVFRKYPELYASSAEIELRSGYIRYLNSEGSWFTRGDTQVKLTIKAETQAADGMPLGDTYQLFAGSLRDLPPKAELLARADTLGGRLRRLHAAKTVERYSGPILFEGDAAGEAFAKVFAPALVGMRRALSDNEQFEAVFERMLGQGGSLTDRVGARVLPACFTVVNDPRRIEIDGVKLPVSMELDDEAVPARSITLIEHGTLKALLSTRVPIAPNLKSTGSRRALGAVPATMLVNCDKGITSGELRKELLRMAKERGSDYGIVVRRVGRGKLADSLFDMAMRMQGQNGGPGGSILEAYKVFGDGHEELVRGAQIEGLALTSFKDIVAAGDKPELYSDEFIPRMSSSFFSGLASATSSGLPVATYSVPSLLFEDLSLKPVQGPYPALPASEPPVVQASGR